MQKLITATIATTAAAIKIEAPTTLLAQTMDKSGEAQVAGINTECHGTYAYQCMQTKVDQTLGALTDGVDADRDASVKAANDMRVAMIEALQDLRAQMEWEVASVRKAGEQSVRAQMKSSIQTIEDRLAYLIEDLRLQVQGDSPIAAERKRLEGLIKDIYYADEQTLKLQGREGKKAQIKALLDGFIAQNFPVFGEKELIELTALVAQETEAMLYAVEAAQRAYSEAAAAAALQLQTRALEQAAALEAADYDRIAALNARIAELTVDFLKIFWETVEEIYRATSYNERQGLIWKALYQKDAFIAGVNAIRDEMVQQLADNRAQMAAQAAAEMQGFAAFVDFNRTEMNAALAKMRDNMRARGAKAIADLKAEIDRLSPQSPDKNAEVKNLEQFIYDTAVIRFNPNVNGEAHADGVQPYAKWVGNQISDNIAIYGADTMRTFDSDTRQVIADTQLALVTEQTGLHADNVTAQTLLNSQTAGLVADLVAVREALELRLQGVQDSIELRVEAEREQDMIEMTTIQNGLWKDLSWIVRSTLAGGNHNHGYRSGPAFGYLANFAQVSDDNPVNFLEKRPAQGWGAEGPEDGYDPYGFGDWGWGFGPSQTQKKEVQGKLDDMEATWARMEAQRAARMAVARAEMEAAQAVARGDWEVALGVKWDSMQANIDAMNAKWAQTKADRTATFFAAVADARARIAEANRVKIAALDAEEKEVRWAITSIWNYDSQHALNEALTAAREARDAECAALNRVLEADLAAMLAAWQASLVSEQASLDANTEAALATCDFAKVSQSALLREWMGQQMIRYTAWETRENQIVADHIAASREAWEWIQVSYCLRHGQAGDVTQVGHGCSWGEGAGAGNAGFKKGVAIENHMAALTYGQDPIDIKHIHDEAWLIEGARAWTMEGVPEESARLVTYVGDVQADIQARIQSIRGDLEAQLLAANLAADARMDALADAEAAYLLAREEGVLAAVHETSLGWQAEIDALREEVQWLIKEEVWKLGYTQGYKFGAHDGQDAEIMAGITAEKERYEAEIVERLRLMAVRVEAELSAAEVEYTASQARADALQAQETADFEALIVRLTAAMQQAIADGDADLAATMDKARAELKAFIDARLAAWQALYDQEAVNAKWQEDSYYRLNLLRLLGEKQAAIDADVARTYREFEAALAAMKIAQGEFNAGERAAWHAHVVACREAFVAAVARNDARMADIISTRRASLEAGLAAESKALLDAMNADRAEMKRLLKEIYNYNTHDIDATASADGVAAPWSVEQHNAFMAKLHYWSREQLSGKDALLANYRDEYAAAAATALEAAQAESVISQRRVEDQRDAAATQIERLVEDALTHFQEFSDLEFTLLQEGAAALRTEVAGKIEGFRKQVIYSMHVLRYAGGYDVEQTGFGVGASSYYGGGNALTGHDELDNFRLGNPHGYAQVADKHGDDLEIMLNGARDGVLQVVAEARATALSETLSSKQDVRDEEARLLALVVSTGDALLGAQAALVAEVEGQMAAHNAARKQAMADLTGARVATGEAICDVNLAKIDGWIADRLAWAEKMHESYRKRHLIQELTDTSDRLHASFEALRATMIADAQSANDSLWVALGGVAADLAAYNAAMTASLSATVGDATDAYATGADAIAADFDARADAGLARFNGNMDDALTRWAYWLKYTYGYQGYESSIYQDFDPSANYADILGFPSGDGAYSDLGTQGPDLANSGEVQLPSGGFGYGGRGGVDYVFSGDHAAEAYGKFVGPSSDFFDGSILDALDEKKGLIDQTHTRYH